MLSWKLLMSLWPLLFSSGARSAVGRQFQPTFQSSRATAVIPSSRINNNCRLPVRHSNNNLQQTTHLPKSRLHSSSKSTTEPLKTLEGNDIFAAEEVIKKSRFIGYASYCTSWDEAQTILESVRKDHPKSRHVCFGFVSSSGSGGNNEGSGTERCSDDGEPTGTAGVPILGAIKGEGLSDTICIVVRYSGGIKLGAGGLIRAYGGTGRLVLRSAPTQVHIPKSTIRISTRTANSGAIYSLAAKYGGVTSGETYNDRGELEVAITCDEENGELLKEGIIDATRGGVMFLE
ncbi:hypothetical protein ACHAXR_000892 [Thalassiosira sp. AJA248-18]